MQKITIFLLIFFISFTGCRSHRKVTQTNRSKNNWEMIYQKYKGTGYRYGGTNARGFDCSGFVQRAYQDAYGISLPRTTKAMMKTGKKINKNNLKSGDLVFFHPTRKYYHVGIYLGKGIFMHASSSKGVTKSDIHHKYWEKSYVTARRILTR